METLQPREEFLSRAEVWLGATVPQRWADNRGALSEDEKIQIRSDWDRQLYEGGYAGLSIPREYGGQGLGLREEVLFHEAAARAHAPEGIGRVGKILTAPTLIKHGTSTQRSAYLPGIIRGEQVWCQGFSEPGAGSDLANITSTARKVDGGYLVTGQKTWTSFAQYAEKAILLARTDVNAPQAPQPQLLPARHGPARRLLPHHPPDLRHLALLRAVPRRRLRRQTRTWSALRARAGPSR